MRFLEALKSLVIILLFSSVIVLGLIIFFISNNNIDQDLECERMKEYGYNSYIEKEKFVKTCWIVMEDGISIRSYDYSIADNRDALRLIDTRSSK